MSQKVEHSSSPPDASKPYCLMNSDGSVADWFATHDAAVAAMRKTTSASRMYSESFLTPVTLEFAEGDGVWIEALQARTYHTPQYGEVVVTTDKLNNFVNNFKSNVRGIDITTDFEHGTDPAKGKKASGTIKDARVEGDKLLLNVGFTDTAKEELKAGEWKYFSSDWVDEYVHEDGSKHTDVLLGGGLTNRPVAKGLQTLPINFSEFYDEKSTQFATLTAAQRNALPASKFLYIESDGTRHLPVPDEGHIRAAITRLSQKATGTVAGEAWLTDSLRSSLLAKARAMLSKKQLGENMNELLKRFAEQLGITFSEDTTEEDLSEKVFAELKATSAKITALETEVAPLRELKKSTEQAISFSEQFPEQAAQMEEDRKFRITANARTFSETIGNMRFAEHVGKKDSEGNDVVVTTTKGLSAKVLDMVKEAHLKFSEGTGDVDALGNIITAIMDGGVVDYGEKGTAVGSGPEDTGDTTPTGSILEVRTAFTEKVKAVMSDNENMTFAEALPIAAKNNPKMYEAYMGAK